MLNFSLKKFSNKKSYLIISFVFLLILGLYLPLAAKADAVWSANPNGVNLNNSYKAGKITDLSLKFTLGASLNGAADTLSLDLSGFLVNHDAAELEANYSISGVGVNMDNTKFTAAEAGGIITITLADAANSIASGQEIMMVILGVAANRGAGNVEIKLRTSQETNWVSYGDITISTNAMSPDVILDDNTVNANSKATITYTTDGAVPSNGKIIFTLPITFGLMGAAVSNISVNDGAPVIIDSVNSAVRVLTIILNEPGGIAEGTAVTITVGTSTDIITNQSTLGVTDNFSLETKDGADRVIQTGTDTVLISSNAWNASEAVILAAPGAGRPDQITLKFSSGAALSANDTIIINFSNNFLINNSSAIEENKYIFTGTGVTMNNDGTDFTAMEAGGIITFTLLNDAVVGTNEITLVIDSSVITNSGANDDVDIWLKTSKQSSYINSTASAETDAITENTVAPALVLDSYETATSSKATITYTSVGLVPANGRIILTLPDAFTLSTTTSAEITVNDGASVAISSAVNINKNVDINLGRSINSGALVNIVIGVVSDVITNQADPGISGNFILETKDNISRVIQTGSATVPIAPPVINSFSPISEYAGQTFAIIGAKFRPGATVKFNSANAEIISLSSARIEVKVPALAVGGYSVVVTNSDTTFSNDMSFNITQSPTGSVVVSNGSGGGGAPGAPEEPAKPRIEPEVKTITPQVLGEKIYAEKVLTQLEQIAADSSSIWSENLEMILANAEAKRDSKSEINTSFKYLNNLISGQGNLSSADSNRLNFFITYGTPGTKVLGAGERAGVINSYKSAFNKLPKTEKEWQDAIKIANGRWTSDRSAKVENQAKIEFIKIYHRDANLKNNIDENAIMVIAYGLLSSKRNLNNEEAAIKTFKSVYRHTPVNALAWNVVRAVAYSGAKR